MTERAFWHQPLEHRLAELLATSDALTSEEAAQRLLHFGPNDAATAREWAAWVRFLGRFDDPLIIILSRASAVSTATGDTAGFVIVFCMITHSVTMDFTQEHRAQNANEALRKKVALRTGVRCNGQQRMLPVEQLVRGDIVRLIAGDLVPADRRLIAARDFFVNRASHQRALSFSFEGEDGRARPMTAEVRADPVTRFRWLSGEGSRSHSQHMANRQNGRRLSSPLWVWPSLFAPSTGAHDPPTANLRPHE